MGWWSQTPSCTNWQQWIDLPRASLRTQIISKFSIHPKSSVPSIIRPPPNFKTVICEVLRLQKTNRFRELDISLGLYSFSSNTFPIIHLYLSDNIVFWLFFLRVFFFYFFYIWEDFFFLFNLIEHPQISFHLICPHGRLSGSSHFLNFQLTPSNIFTRNSTLSNWHVHARVPLFQTLLWSYAEEDVLGLQLHIGNPNNKLSINSFPMLAVLKYLNLTNGGFVTERSTVGKELMHSPLQLLLVLSFNLLTDSQVNKYSINMN